MIEVKPLGESPRPNHRRYVQSVQLADKILANMEVVRQTMLDDDNRRLLLRYMEVDERGTRPPELERWGEDGNVYGGDPDCEHVVDPWASGSGVHCLYCSAWFCW